MAALLRKDFYATGRNYFIMMGAALLFNVVPMFRSLGYTYAMLLAFTVPTTSISADEKCGWDRLAAMLPYRVEQLVWSKYIFAYLYTAASTVIILTGAAVWGMENLGAKDWGDTAGTVFMMLLVMLLVMLLMIDINIPLLYLFGSETGRMVMLILAALVSGIAVVVLQAVFAFGLRVLLHPALLAAAAAVIVGSAFLSFRLSVRFYRKQRDGLDV